ncbi:hypothetical protein RQP46_005530 [Phenoliferia psychrophenolica]
MAPIGPSLPRPAGPQLPPSVSLPAPAPAADDDSSDDDFGPSLPPDLVAARSSAPTAGPSLPSKVVQGPSLPPGFAPPSASSSSSYRRETPLSAPYLDDDDDDFGPMPLPAGMKPLDNDGARAFKEREEREAEKRRKEAAGKGKPQREEWMLVPPKEMDLMSTMDTTKLKSRTFQQSTKVVTGPKPGGPNLWTETPAERQQRMQDELMGVKRKVENATVEDESDDKRRKRERDYHLKEEVERHNVSLLPNHVVLQHPDPTGTDFVQKSARNTSMLDAHSKSSKKADPKEKEVPGIWDRDRDMSLGGRLMDGDKRADIVKSAKELGGRFGGGSYL